MTLESETVFEYQISVQKNLRILLRPTPQTKEHLRLEFDVLFEPESLSQRYVELEAGWNLNSAE